MTYKTNISIFLPNGSPNGLFESYRILVAIELALKDGGFSGGSGGHDIPAMLAQVSVRHPLLAGKLNVHQSRLIKDLDRIFCNSKDNIAIKVKPNNYPHIRYARLTGDWDGLSETPMSLLIVLAQTCNSLLNDLQTHKIMPRIQI